MFTLVSDENVILNGKLGILSVFVMLNHVSCPQGEQCNIVPDTVDDIVADIGQEEKEEGVEALYLNQFGMFNLKATHSSCWTCFA